MASLAKSRFPSVTKKFDVLKREQRGGQGTEILLKERAKDGYFGQPNAYWMLTLFSLNGRPWPALPVLVFALYAAGVCAICIYGLGLDSQTVVMLSSLRDVATIIGLAVFLLLSFRNQAAYSRWWDGATAFYYYAGGVKEMACMVTAVMAPEYPQECEELLWWLIAGLEASKAALRESQDFSFLYPILPSEMLSDFLSSENKVMYSSYRFMRLLVTLPHVSLNEVLKVHPPIARDFAACLRILETPLPFVYLSHLRAFIALWLGVLPWFFVANLRWWTMLLCLIISWGVLGVEEAAVEVEQPYGMDFNDLPLDSITQGVYDSVHDMARIVRGQRAAGASGKARSEPVHVNGKNSYGDGSERISEV